MDWLPTKRKLMDNIDVISPILKRYRNDNDISIFFLTISIGYDMVNIDSIYRLDDISLHH